MTNPSESVTTSAAKVAAVTTGAVLSGFENIGTYLQFAAWGTTILYGMLQIVKCMPWLSTYTKAFWQGVRHGDWAAWFALGKKSGD